MIVVLSPGVVSSLSSTLARLDLEIIAEVSGFVFSARNHSDGARRIEELYCEGFSFDKPLFVV